MRLLLDTHALLWWLAGGAELSAEARAAIAEPGNQVLVSAASVWEIGIKQARGKLRAPEGLLEQIERHRFRLLPIEGAHALGAAALPPLHPDPFDRMLVAQAQAEGLCIVTRDPAIPAYAVPIIAA